MVLQLVRQQQGGEGFRQPGDMLGDVDQCDGKIPRGAQNGNSQCADQNDVAGGGSATLPKHDGPGQQRDRQQDGDRGMRDPQFFEIAQAASPRRHFPIDGRVEPIMLETETAKRAHQRHVVDDIDHLAIDGGGLVGEVVVQGLAGGRQMKHRDHHRAGDHDQPRRHHPIHGTYQRNGRNGCNARRQHVPDEHVLDGENGIGGRRDAARQHPRQAVREIARRMSGQMAENVPAEVAGDADKRKAGGPAGDPPQRIVRRYQ